ncbi:MAG: T9SS type A sorting domain-containing protein [Hymenobacteraceae bacterium]|nr:T9SS type A sorting domain-containing protein [Hymenobacteraceae bacterium]MDX5396882.1 T9SS type A sorting domain-containing protein [Hymenobacteraceae bacterium]MDX5512953.1 T9SS type A sorting domain-containing protein [Hymenobacteraceae bacterium]
MKTTLLAWLLFACATIATQAQTIEWIKKQDVYVDNNAFPGIYIVNSPTIALADSVVFTASEVYDSTIYSNITVIRRNDYAGNVGWRKELRSNSTTTNPFAVTSFLIGADAGQNAVITGRFKDFLLLGGDTIFNLSGINTFLLKIDGAGNVVWVQQVPMDVSADMDAAGNIYLTGTFSGTTTIGNQVISNTINQSSEIYIAKLNPAGQVQWIRTAGTGNNEQVYSIKVSPAGEAVIYGTVVNGATFRGAGAGNNYTIPDSGTFVVKYNTAGTINWGKVITGASSSVGSMDVDDTGNIYLFGYLWSADLVFDNLVLQKDTSKFMQYFIAKADGNGNWLWVNKLSMEGHYARVIRMVVGKEIYLTGSFVDTLRMAQQISYSEFGSTFIAGYDAGGNESWLKTLHGSSANAGLHLAVHEKDLFVSGFFYDSLYTQVDTIVSPLGKQPWCPMGVNDTWLAKFSTPVTTAINKQLTKNLRQLYLYPNPATETLTIEAELEKPQPVTLKLLNMLGQELQTVRLGEQQNVQHQLQVQHLPKGMYLLQLQAGAETVTQRVVVE